ncbi:CerR family C-terminal domain-containing protein [Stenotrophomonas sp. Sm10]|uniref:TetR/AcrR family transcriptional regulator n=1 Tax=Stenotrophomonas sp. Sm10 TaxID=3002754 RepID=UPI0027E4AA50|nr:CerR family C-terminal domain-containing protein [Stenotrophomonas sp. Sm10]MDQ7310549.1 CerR family C-terminal domain-containing protein [Stenotrophomonas sp. Sm10]
MNDARRAARVDGAATRSRILEGAGELFARHGYAETTGKAIAEKAGVDLASINYHFGNRSGLYQAVLAEAHSRLVSLSDLSRLTAAELSPSDRLRSLFQSLVDSILLEGGWHVDVLAREIGSPTSHFQHLLSAEIEPKLVHVMEIVSSITGIPVRDPALLRCLISVASPCLVMLLGRNLPGPMRAVARMPPADLVAHLHTFAMAGLTSIGRQHSSAA